MILNGKFYCLLNYTAKHFCVVKYTFLKTEQPQFGCFASYFLNWASCLYYSKPEQQVLTLLCYNILCNSCILYMWNEINEKNYLIVSTKQSK